MSQRMVLLSMTSPHFLHLIAFLIIFGIISPSLAHFWFSLFHRCHLCAVAAAGRRTSPEWSFSSYLALPACSPLRGSQSRLLQSPTRVAYPSDWTARNPHGSMDCGHIGVLPLSAVHSSSPVSQEKHALHNRYCQGLFQHLTALFIMIAHLGRESKKMINPHELRLY